MIDSRTNKSNLASRIGSSLVLAVLSISLVLGFRNYSAHRFIHSGFVDLDRINSALSSNDVVYSRQLCFDNLARILIQKSELKSRFYFNKPAITSELERLENFYSNKLTRIETAL
jgi:hypothetical protein